MSANGVRRLRLAVSACGVLAAAAAPAQDRVPTASPFEAMAIAADSIRYAVKAADANLVGATLTNYGFIGNNFVSRAPSLEYPLGSGFEHMVRGGLWFGARAIDEIGAFTGVVTGAVDGAQGSSSQGATEYTPAGLDFLLRSALPTSRFFRPDAVSEQDYLASFSDRPARRAAGNNEDHRPMGILVEQENFSWSFSDYAHVLFFRYRVINQGPPMADAWLGLYSEFASGDKNAYSVWPPSSSGSTVGSWYAKKWLQYDDSLRLLREHYCALAPVPDNCNLAYAPYWIGMKLLGLTPGNLSDTLDKRVTVAAWNYSPGSAARDEDTERYAILSAGTIQDVEADSLLPTNGQDPVSLLAVGPFAQVDPGDTIVVDFAIVGGAEIADIQRVAATAQRAYDRNYRVPVPPPSPRFQVVARSGALDLYWDDSAESFPDSTSPDPLDFEGYRVYVGEDRFDLQRIGQFDLATAPNDTTGFNTGLDGVRLATPVVLDGVTYHYRYTVPSLRNGFKYFAAVTSYDLGTREIESLESGVSQNKRLAVPAPAPGEHGGKAVVFPNPYRVEARWDQGERVRDHYLWFANLPERCTLRIYTLAGDLVFETRFDGRVYSGGGTRGLYDPRQELDVPAPTLSGATFAWDMISRDGQAIATGLYLYSVEPDGGGDRQVGKFLIVKSDREGF